MFCPSCGRHQPADHRYCIECGSRVPRELLTRGGPKVSRWFWSVPVAPSDPVSAALRVTRYVEDVELRTAEGSVRVPSRHVRFSVWHEDHAVGAVSIPDEEASALADFLLASVAAERETSDSSA